MNSKRRRTIKVRFFQCVTYDLLRFFSQIYSINHAHQKQACLKNSAFESTDDN